MAVMRNAADDRHGWRVRAIIVVLWRAGLRVQEALALAEHDLDPPRASGPGTGRPRTPACWKRMVEPVRHDSSSSATHEAIAVRPQ